MEFHPTQDLLEQTNILNLSNLHQFPAAAFQTADIPPGQGVLSVETAEEGVETTEIGTNLQFTTT